jgi:hypothetical protein
MINAYLKTNISTLKSCTMNKFLFILSMVACFQAAVAQTTQTSTFVPPGTVKVGDLFFDEYEVSNYAWIEYLTILRADSTFPQYIAAVPDTTVWYNVYEEELATDYMLNYLYDEMTQYHPVVGISFFQAQDYCFWRSTVVNKQLRERNRRERVFYRLPTPEEWEQVAQQHVSYNLDQISIPRSRLEQSFDRNRIRNIKRIVETENTSLDRARSLNEYQEDIINFFIANPIYLFENLYFDEVPYFWPALRNGQKPLEINFSSANIKNLRGNVSEMTSIRNVAKGGNWTTSPSESLWEYDLIYSGASALVGFRCVCEVSHIEDTTEPDADIIEWKN